MSLLRFSPSKERFSPDTRQRRRGSHTSFSRLFVFSRMPRRLDSGCLRLRPLSIFDGPFIHRELGNNNLLKATGLDRPLSSSWPGLWWWFKNTYALSYCIEVASKRIGFLGLFNIDPGESAELSLVIFNRGERRLGYGTTAFNLLAENLRRCALVGKMLVRVRTGNDAALSFWSKLGFNESGSENDIRLMSAELFD